MYFFSFVIFLRLMSCENIFLSCSDVPCVLIIYVRSHSVVAMEIRWSLPVLTLLFSVDATHFHNVSQGKNGYTKNYKLSPCYCRIGNNYGGHIISFLNMSAFNMLAYACTKNYPNTFSCCCVFRSSRSLLCE